MFEKQKQEDVLAKLYLYAMKPNEDKIREILTSIYLNDESLQNEFMEEVFYEAVNNEVEGQGFYDGLGVGHEYHEEEDLANDKNMNEEYQHWHEDLIQ